jgi:hypothetical protein
MLRETLEDGADDHDQGTTHNAPPTTPALIAVGSNGDCENGSELIARGDESKQSGLNGIIAVFVQITISEIYSS